MTASRPALVPADSFRTHYDTPDKGFEVRTAIDAESHGSRLELGVQRIRSGTERVSWTPDKETAEAYYLQQGSLRVTWSQPEAGECTLNPGDCMYLPGGNAYSLENVGDDDVHLVWAVRRSDPWGDPAFSQIGY
jgi:mannose-6-phosphate isomerase-like protein (cupin superfamily)